MAALIFGGIAIPVRGAVLSGGTHVFACPSGLICLREEVEVLCWDDVATVRYEVGQNTGVQLLPGNYPLFKVRRSSDGYEFVFDNYLPRVRELGRLIEKKTLKHLPPPEQEAFDEGELLRFGPLAISRKGIRRGGDWLRWDEVKDVTLDRKLGQIVISKERQMAWPGTSSRSMRWRTTTFFWRSSTTRSRRQRGQRTAPLRRPELSPLSLKARGPRHSLRESLGSLSPRSRSRGLAMFAFPEPRFSVAQCGTDWYG